MKKRVVIGFLGTVLDEGSRPKRWEKWRPTIALGQQEDWVVDRLELIYSRRYSRLLELITRDLAAVSPETEVVPRLVELDDPWDFEQVYAALHDFARAYPFDTEAEEYLVHITTGTHVAQICLFLLTEARYFPASLLQSSPPPRQRIGEGIGALRVIDLDLSRYDLIARRFAEERAADLSLLKSGIATRNPAFNRMIDAIERVAIRSRAPILLLGPTGAGKSFLARQVYQLKRRRHQLEGAFVEVNCATLHGEGTMAALFGHTRGAYTGAVGERAGLLRQADGGLLFLDEIGDLGLDEQAMLLKAIEEHRFYPLGSDQEVESDFQLIAGTCRDLQRDIESGRFRDDLYARINLWTFPLPGLAERREDIEPNISFELERQGRELGHLVRFNKPALSRYLAYATSPEARWRGNFRELSASVTRLATLAEGGRITESEVQDEIDRLRTQWHEEPVGKEEGALIDLLGREVLTGIDRFDRMQLAAVLDVCRRSASLSDAGRTLFDVSRQRKRSSNDADRIRKYLARFGLDWERVNLERAFHHEGHEGTSACSSNSANAVASCSMEPQSTRT